MRARTAALLALTGAAAAAAAGLERHRREQVDIWTGRIPAWHEYWRTRDRAPDGAFVLVVLGDSAALGIGASRPWRGWAGLAADRIAACTGRPVRVRNLAIDGARVATVLGEELRRVPRDPDPDLVLVGVGANDVWRTDPAEFAADLDRLLTALPRPAVVGELPSFTPLPVAGRAAALNRAIHEVAARHGVPVAPVSATTGRGGVLSAFRNAAGDLFHPNDRGHARWAEAYLPLVDRALQQAPGTPAG